jgi:hypothetical protein
MILVLTVLHAHKNWFDQMYHCATVVFVNTGRAQNLHQKLNMEEFIYEGQIGN